MMKKLAKNSILILICVQLSGCLGGFLPNPEKEKEDIENEAAATGASCRQAGKSLEECFKRNEDLNRKGALRGWKEMDAYMREFKLEPQIEKEIHTLQEEKSENLEGNSNKKEELEIKN